MEVIHPCKYSLECSHAIVKLFLPQRNAKAVVGELLVDEAVNAVVEDGKQKVTVAGKDYLADLPVREYLARMGERPHVQRVNADRKTNTAEMPHGGVKLSGYGSDLSVYCLEHYTVARHVMIRH